MNGPRTLPPLADEGNRYAFFQAMRLLRLELGNDAALRDNVRVRPNLSLGFPETDIQHVSRDADGRYRIEANFFGLYGVASPLPTFYTEDLIDEHMEGRTSVRDFLDIIHASLYPVLFQAWEKYRIWLAISEHGDDERLEQLRALVGMQGRPQLAERAGQLLPHAGNLSWRPRSALGLQGFLHDHLGGLPVRVQPCVRRQVSIPVPDRCLLGEQAATLGENSSLGSLVADNSSSLEIRVGPLNADAFQALLPAQAEHDSLVAMTLHYLEKPLHCELQLLLDAPQARGVNLGQGWHRLGLETWLGDHNGVPQPPATRRHAWPRAVRIPLPRTLPAPSPASPQSSARPLSAFVSGELTS